MTRRVLFSALILVVAAGALAFRLPRLSARPMHTDEANQAYKAGLLLDHGVYRYDPHQHHGPTLYYLTLPSFWLSGVRRFAESTEANYRIVPVVFGTGLVLLLLLVGDGLGWPAALCAGVLTAVSPAMVFYSRYYIQETLLVFFTFGAIAAGWRYAWTRRLRWALLAGVFLGLMHATKETCILAYVAMGLAAVSKVAWRRWWGYPLGVRKLVSGRHLAVAIGVAVVVSVVFFSSLFTHARGPLDSILCYTTYLERSGGDALHRHPWHYYLSTLAYTHLARGPWWSEALIMGLALFGFATVVLPRGIPAASTPLARFIAFYTLFLTAAYCVIPYKTPWCLLGFLHGMILLAGVGVVVVVSLVPKLPLKIAAGALLALGGWQLAGQAYRASYRFAADRRNPYVYAHTSHDVLNLAEQVEGIAAVAPDGHDLLIHVIAPESDYWPLPWYLRRFRRVGYWGDVPDSLGEAGILIFSDALQERVDAGLAKGKPAGWELTDHWMSIVRGLRPTVHLLVYIRKDLWDRFIETRAGPSSP